MHACVSCGAELRAGAKFCDQCGTATTTNCVACGAELRPGAKFCDNCGANQASGPAATATIAETTPSASRRISERKVTSVLFGDLVSFTTLSEQHDKEDVRELLSHYFTQCRRIVARYGGTIEKFIGDAVMAVWGVPVAHEDDAERAVRAGIELVRDIESLGESLGLPGLPMRVGIVTGEVAVTIGAEHEGMVAGDAVNTAARVQSVASQGEVWVDETTRLLTSGAITFVDVGSHELKGKAEPVPLWAVRAVVAAVGGAQRADGLEAPLTGRGRELRVIKELFHGVEDSGRPSLVLVSGDPGLGKSRLAWEFFKYIDGLTDPVMWHGTRCLAYGDGVAFWPIAEAVRGRIGLLETDQDTDPASALDAWLAAHVPDESEASWVRARVLALIGSSSAGGFDRDDQFAAWQTFFERAGDGAPVVLVVDDAQHADEGTIAFVEHLLTNAEFPAFVVLMSRPGLLQRWPDLATNRRATVLHLATLDDAEMAELLDGLVSGLPSDVRDGLVERAQGVPLYAIETVRSLIDRDLVVPRGGVYVLADPAAVDLAAIGAPASLHALVAARLDGLPTDQRRLVADASVLGNTFTRDAITALAADLPSLDDTLAALVRAEVLGMVTSRLSAEYGQYRFVQDVVRQVAYNTQSKRDRKARHLAVAGYFETLPDPGGDFAPVLAQHYLDAIESSGATDPDLADLRESAARNLRGAASRARALGAPGDALRHLDSALSLHPDDAATAELRLLAAWAATDAVHADEAEAHARAALAYYEDAGDVLRAGEAAAVLAIVLAFLRADLAGALAIAKPPWEALQGVRGAEPVLLELARSMTNAQLGLNVHDTALGHARLAIAEATGDRLALAESLNALALLSSRSSPVYARLLFRACVDLAREEQRPVVAGKGLMNLALLTAVNDLVAANAISDEAIDEMRRTGGHPFQLQMLMGNKSALALESARLDQSRELAEAMDAEAPPGAYIAPFLHGMLADVRGPSDLLALPGEDVRSADDKSVMSLVAGADMFTAKRAGDLRSAARIGLEAVLNQYEISGFTDDLVHIWPFAANMALAAGDREIADRLVAVVDEQPPGFLGIGVRAHRKRVAGLLGAQDGSGEAEPLLRAAIEEFTAWGSPLWAARARAELAAWLIDRGRADEAAVLRHQAAESLREAGADGWLAELGLLDAPVPSGVEVS